MTYTHFLYCPFTGLGLYHGYRGDVWLTNRIRIFNQFVLPSILNQTTQDFILWISWRPEEKTNPIVQRFGEHLSSIRNLNFIFTYYGVCFYDDKYDDAIARERLFQSLTRTLPELADAVRSSDYVLVTIQPSDDMYLSKAVETIQNFFKEYEHYDGLGFSKGYIMRYDTKEVAEYDPTTTPPFYSIKFEKETFLNSRLHFDFTGAYQSHEYVEDSMTFHHTPERAFVVGIHGENISTVWDHTFKGRSLSYEEQEKVMMETDSYFTEPLIVVKDNRRIWMKRTLNLLPLFLQKKIICYLSGNGTHNQIKMYKYFNV